MLTHLVCLHSLHATRASSTFSCSPLLIRLLFSHHSSARTRPAPFTPGSRRRRSSASALLAPSSRQPRSSRKRCAQRPPRVDEPSLLFHQHHHLVETINVFQGSCPRVVHKKKAVSSACAAAPLPRAHTRSPVRRTIFEEFSQVYASTSLGTTVLMEHTGCRDSRQATQNKFSNPKIESSAPRGTRFHLRDAHGCRAAILGCAEWGDLRDRGRIRLAIGSVPMNQSEIFQEITAHFATTAVHLEPSRLVQ